MKKVRIVEKGCRGGEEIGHADGKCFKTENPAVVAPLQQRASGVLPKINVQKISVDQSTSVSYLSHLWYLLKLCFALYCVCFVVLHFPHAVLPLYRLRRSFGVSCEVDSENSPLTIGQHLFLHTVEVGGLCSLVHKHRSWPVHGWSVHLLWLLLLLVQYLRSELRDDCGCNVSDRHLVVHAADVLTAVCVAPVDTLSDTHTHSAQSVLGLAQLRANASLVSLVIHFVDVVVVKLYVLQWVVRQSKF